jgi:SAM-dependent methyltransferase
MNTERERQSFSAWAEMVYKPDSFDMSYLLSLVNRGDRVLDLGCSTGNLTLLFPEYGATVTGIDLSEHRLQMARRDAELMGLSSKAHFICGDLTDPNFFKSLGHYQIVCAIRSLTCVVEPKSLANGLLSIWQRLAPDGLVYISDFCYDPFNPAYAERYTSHGGNWRFLVQPP